MLTNFVYLIVAASILFVYYDTTKNKIGKISGEKGFLNLSPGLWAIATWLLWIVAFPLYLINRSKLIEKAKQNPQEISDKKRKVVLGILGVIVALVFLNFIAVSGCSQSVPKCGDTKTIDLVTQIADREMGKQLGAEAAKIFSYSLGAIRTTNTNEQTGAHECACQLSITASNTGQTNEIPITYTVEKTDKGDEIYVNVFGL